MNVYGKWFLRALFCAGVVWGTCYSDKPGGLGRRFLNFVFLDENGKLLDPSHSIVTNQAVCAIFHAACGVRHTAEDALAIAQGVNGVTNEVMEAVDNIAENTHFFALSLPPPVPDEPSGNISIRLKRHRAAEQLECFFEFSSVPTQNVQVHIEAAASPWQWQALAPVTNDWPNVVEGCIRYVYELPPGLRGKPLILPREITLGGPDGQLMRLPPDGLYVVDENCAAWTPFNGTDVFEDDAGNMLEIDYRGGVAVEARFNGERIAP